MQNEIHLNFMLLRFRLTYITTQELHKKGTILELNFILLYDKIYEFTFRY